MSEDGLNPRETVLRLIATAAPEPWYPRLYAKQSVVDRDALSQCLEELALSGLVEKVAGSPETGPGVSLTREGERVLLDPEALERLRAGEPLSPRDRAAVLRQVLRSRTRAGVTALLVLINILVFAGGYYAARQIQADDDFFRGTRLTPQMVTLLERSGALTAADVLEGRWWRLLTSGFVHIGFMHLLLSMLWLYLAGRFVERTWGHVRMLILFLVSVLGGSCLGVVHHVGLNADTAGGTCGLLGAEAVWYLLNRSYLPRALRRQLWTNLALSIILLVFIGSFKDVTRWGCYGGGAAGAIAALLLHLHRFGPPVWRWLAILGFGPMIWYGSHVIEQARATDKDWQEVEDKLFVERFHRPIRDIMNQSAEVYADEVQPVLETHPTRRDPEEVEAALTALAQQQSELETLAEQLVRAGPYGSPDAEEARQTSHAYVLAQAELFVLAQHILRLGDKRTDKDKQALRQQQEKVKDMRSQWDDLFK
jgi:rhomboid protease GluP